jgi:subtilisin family serine protease
MILPLKTFSTLIRILLFCLLLPSCGGGGGGGGTASPIVSQNNPTLNSTKFKTAEYNSQLGLEKMNVADAYAYLESIGKISDISGNGPGHGVKVAVIDTGIESDHIELSANLDKENSKNTFIDNANSPDSPANYQDIEGHGTFVSSIIAGVKNNVGMHGVAYDSKIIMFKKEPLDDNLALVDYGKYFNNIAESISTASNIESVKVINLSNRAETITSKNGKDIEIIASTDGIINISDPNDYDDEFLTALQHAKSKDMVVVASTGNSNKLDSLYAPAVFANNDDVKGYIIAVGAVDKDNNTGSYSVNCGAQKEYCLVAFSGDAPIGQVLTPIDNSIYGAVSNNHKQFNDIDNILTGDNNQKYGYNIGTSFSTPLVSGAVAVIRSAWPNLTAPQVVDLLFKTATDLGEKGVDDIYGHGALNLYEAVKAQGANSIVSSKNAMAGGYDRRESSIVVDPIFGDAFAKNIAPLLSNAVFFDDYGRDYKANLNDSIYLKTAENPFTSQNFLNNDFKSNIIPLSFAGNKNLGLINLKFQNWNLRNKRSIFDNFFQPQILNNSGFSFTQNNQNYKNLVLGFASNFDEVSDLMTNKDFSNNFLSSPKIMANPYQNFVSRNSNAQSTNGFNQTYLGFDLLKDKIKFLFSSQNSYSSRNLNFKIGEYNNKINNFNLLYNSGKTNASLQFGRMGEFNNYFLNSKSLGAFSNMGNSKTDYTKITISKELFSDLTTIASFSEGKTSIAGNKLGLFRDFNAIKSRAFSIGLIKENFLKKGRIGFMYNEPMRVYSGRVLIDIPVGLNSQGEVIRKSINGSLVPSGRQKDFEFLWSYQLMKNYDLNLNFIVSKDHNNIKNNDANLAILSNRIQF